MQKSRSLAKFAVNALKAAAVLWFLVAVIGQLVFAFYIVVFFGGATARCFLASTWARNVPRRCLASPRTQNVWFVSERQHSLCLLGGYSG
jgi:hypothetical protein